MSTVASTMAGTWKFESSENFDAFLKEIGVSWATRQGVGMSKPTLTISVDDRHVAIKQESSFGSMVTAFDLDVEFDEKTSDGRQCKSVVREIDGKLVHEQRGKVDATITRHIEGDTLVVTLEANGVTAVRKFKKI